MIKKILKLVVSKNAYEYLYRKKIELFGGAYAGFHGLDRKLEKYVDYDNGFYVELGANDGFRQSNSFHFELRRGWRGVLIEPAPHLFLSCQKLRGRNNFVYCNACVDFGFEDRFVEITYANLMSVSKSLDLDLESIEEHIITAKNQKMIEESFSFGAIAKTLDSLLNASDAPKIIDFLSLDVEGAELDVLKGVDLTKYTFKFMLIECRKIDRLEKYLVSKNYKLIDQLSKHDYLFAPKDNQI